MTRLVTILLTLFILSGCATQRIPFPEAELAAINTKGNITIKGELSLIDQLEEKQVGSEQEITLEPVSPYSNQWYQVVFLGDKPIKKADPRYEQYVKKTTTDKKGMFSIAGVGPGEYYLTGTLMWRAQDCSANWVKTPVLVSNKLEVKSDTKIMEVKLTKPWESPTEICDLYNQGDWEKEDDF